MKQARLFPKPRAEKKSNVTVAAGHDENNLRSAQQILENTEHWGVEEAGLVKWARAVVERLTGKATGGTI